MKPQERARDLRDRMWLKIPSVYDPTGMPHYPIAKEMALIAVDEILEVLYVIFESYEERRYWLEVKAEIEKL